MVTGIGGAAGSTGRALHVGEPASLVDTAEIDANSVLDGSGPGTFWVTGSNVSPGGAVGIRVRDPNVFPSGFANATEAPTREFCPRFGPCRLYLGGNFGVPVQSIPCNQGVVEVRAHDVRSDQTVSKILATFC
jgi:hypothetical protein